MALCQLRKAPGSCHRAKRSPSFGQDLDSSFENLIREALMNAAARWWPLWLLSLVLISAEASGQETLWETYKAAGNKAFQQARSAEAERLFVAAIEQAEKFGKHDPRLAESLNSLAVLYATQGKQVEAEPLFRRALEINAQVFGPEHPDVATTLSNLAPLYATQGKYTDAEHLFGRALSINIKVSGPGHPTVASNLRALAALHAMQGNFGEAERFVRRSLEIDEKTLGPEHPDVAASLEVFAALLRTTHRDTEAEKLETRAKEIRARQAQAHSSD
jgi:tetratricopeptide (TPR) repeat protein